MKNIALCLFAAVGLVVASAPALAESAPAVAVSAGKVIYDSKGHRIGSIYRVTPAGDAQVIYNGKLVTIPASTLSVADAKITTSVSRADLSE